MPPRTVKVFTASVFDEDNLPEPYPFALQFLVVNGHGVPTGEVEEHEFTAAAHPGAGASFTAAAVLRWDSETGQRGVDLNAIVAFLTRVMDEEDLTRLRDLLDRKDRSIELEQIADVYKWLTEEYSGRPTKQSGRSSTGRRITGPRSMEALSSAGATS